MLKVVSVAIYEHIAQTTTKNHAENHAEDHREKGVIVNANLPTLGEFGNNEKGANEAGNIGQSVPTNLQRPQRKRHGVNCVVNVVERHRGSPSKNSPRTKAGRACVSPIDYAALFAAAAEPYASTSESLDALEFDSSLEVADASFCERGTMLPSSSTVSLRAASTVRQSLPMTTYTFVSNE